MLTIPPQPGPLGPFSLHHFSNFSFCENRFLYILLSFDEPPLSVVIVLPFSFCFLAALTWIQLEPFLLLILCIVSLVELLKGL